MNGEDEDRLAEETRVAEAALESGFGDAPTETKPAEASPPAAVVEDKPADTGASSTAQPAGETPPADKPAQAKPVPPKYVRVTQEQFDAFQAAAAKVAEFGPRLDKLAGNAGTLKSAIDKLQSETPKGQKLEFSPELFAEMDRDYPEFAAQLKKILSGLRGTGATDAKPADTKGGPAPSLDADTVTRTAREAIFQSQLDDLTDSHPDWQDIVGQSESPDQDNPFRKWLLTQTEEYQTKLNNTHSPSDIKRAIDRFEAATATPRQPVRAKPAEPAPKENAPSARRNVIANAVPPKTSGGQPVPQSKSMEDHLMDGFAG